MKSAACAAESAATDPAGLVASIDRGVILEAKKREVSQEVDRLRGKIRLMCSEGERIKGETSASSAEVGESPDVLTRLIEASSRTLQQINAALRRVEAGTYGICFGCEEPIPEERLDALPFALRCRDCEEEAEASRKRFGRSIRG